MKRYRAMSYSPVDTNRRINVARIMRHMFLTQTKFFEAFICPVGFLSCFVILSESYRATAAILLVVLIVSYIHFLRTAKTKLMRLMFGAW